MIEDAQFAALAGDCGLLDRLLGDGLDIDALAGNGYSTLQRAAADGRLDFMRHCVAKGAAVSKQGVHGFSPLTSAVFNGHLDAVRLLVELDADVTVKDDLGWSLLHVAVDQGHHHVLNWLLDTCPADVLGVNHANYDTTYTPLHLSAWNGDAKAVQMLLAAGADVNKLTRHGETAEDLARQRHHDAVGALLSSAATPPDD